jgi:hypothetical protein
METDHQLINKCNKEVADFFRLPRLELNIRFFKYRKEFDKLLHRKTESWIVGLTLRKTIYILEKEKFEIESIHPKSHFEAVLKHEIAHIYFKKLKSGGHPNWLDEGVALHAAGQNFKAPGKLNFKILKHYYRFEDADIYSVGYFMVQNILHDYDKQKLFDLIRLKSSKNLYIELQKMFCWLK